MTTMEGFALGVDVGTSHTVVMLRHPDGRTRPLLFDGQPLLPSAVYLDATGRLHVGADALRLGNAEPGRIEPHPKRHVDDGSALLGGTDVPVPDMLAALLGAVAREAVATAGFLPPAVLTHPASWGQRRRAVLVDALGRAGWPSGTGLVPEPVAAACYFADVLRRPVPVGAALAVFDLGGGTLDVAVVRNEGARWTVAASGGADDLGGLDLDAALVDHLGKSLAGAEPQAWQALTEPVTLAQWRARRRFWEDVRGAKEMLSRSSFAPVPVPGVEQAVHLTRDELEAVADPLVRRGVAEAGVVIAAAGLAPADLAGLFLVGGSSRVPLVARLLHGELGIAPTVLEQPELPVAEGAIIAGAAPAEPVRFTSGPATAATPTPTPPTVSDHSPPITDTRAAAAASTPQDPIAGPTPRDPIAASGGPAAPDAADDRVYADPVDPWATGEAAALAAGGHSSAFPGSPAGFTPPSGQHPSRPPVGEQPSDGKPVSDVPVSGAPVSGAPAASAPAAGARTPWSGPGTAGQTPSERRRFGHPYRLIAAAAVTLVLVAGATLVWIFWPGYRALDYQALGDLRHVTPAVPLTYDWADAEVLDDRAYLASSDSKTGRIGVVAIGTGATKPDWTHTETVPSARWARMVALPAGVALFTDTDSKTDKREMIVLGAERGDRLWQRTLDRDDGVYFAGDLAVIADSNAHRLRGLRVTSGDQRWEQADPGGAKTTVLGVTTPDDLSGPASIEGIALAPDLDDDPRLVQISADRSVRVLDAETGKVLHTRQSVADTNDDVIAHNGRLVVRESESAHRLVAYELDKLGEPRVLYTPQGKESRIDALTACGDDRVCFVEQTGYDTKAATVVAVDAAKGGRIWSYPLPNARALVPVGEAVLATTTDSTTTLIDETGHKVWNGTGTAARLDAGNLLEFSRPPSGSPDDPALAGRHLGDDPVQLGPLAAVNTQTCSWNTSVLACAGKEDFVLQRFAD